MVDDDGTKPVGVAIVSLVRLLTLGSVDLGERVRSVERGHEYRCRSRGGRGLACVYSPQK
jgi:hypothetical protein